MRVEAHGLPFAAGFFDAVLSVDAYQYFGTDALYLAHFVRASARRNQVQSMNLNDPTLGARFGVDG